MISSMLTLNEPAASLLLKSPSPMNPTFQQPSFSLLHASDVNFSQANDISMTSFPGTFMSSAYSHEMKQFSILQERTKCLEGQVMKLMVENNTLTTAFQCLAASVGLRNIDPCQFDGTSFPQVSMLSKQEDLRPTRESSPLIRFWDREDWEKYLESPEGQKSKRGTLGFLEDKDGNLPSLKTGKAIRKLLRGGWAELVNWQPAPMSWGRLPASGRKFIHDLMENAYPMFKFATNGWKLDYLASTSYPAWQRVHLDENGRWKVKKVKGLKTEDDNNDDDDDDNSTGEVSMKWKAMHHTFKTEGPNKKFKGITPSTSSPTFPSPPPSDMHSSSSEASTKHLPAMHEVSPAGITDGKQDDSLSHDTPSVEISIVQSELETATTTSKISINLLAALALAAHKAREIPLLPPRDASEIPQSSPSATITTESNTRPVLELINATLPAATTFDTLDNNMVDSRSKPNKGSGKAKMRPGPTKNGRNLCAHCWRRQVQSSGSTEEFQRYFNDLTATQRQAYDDEAAALVANSKWDTKTICNGTLH